MTTEPTQPQPEMGPAQTNGLGPARGHRRRRRRRKNKSAQPGAPQAQQAQPQQVQAPPPQQQPAQQKPPHMRQNQGRKKKKFFQKGGGGGGGQGPQPGNSINGSNNGRRKDRQKGPRMFVGPMDHSYRAANGNVEDGPPSTIQLNGNGHNHGHSHGGHYADAHQAAPAAVREDAPTRIVCFIEDLFFQAKIQETARKLGIKVEFAKGSDKEVVARMIDADAVKPTLV